MTTYRCCFGIRIYRGTIHDATEYKDLVRIEHIEWAPQQGMHMLFPNEDEEVVCPTEAFQVARVVAIFPVGRPQFFDVQLCPITTSHDKYRATLERFRERLWTVTD